MRTFRKCARQLQILTFGHLAILLDKCWEVLLDPDELVRQGREPLEADLGLDLDIGPVDQSAASIEAVDQSETSIHLWTPALCTLFSFLLLGCSTPPCFFSSPALGACLPLAMLLCNKW